MCCSTLKIGTRMRRPTPPPTPKMLILGTSERFWLVHHLACLHRDVFVKPAPAAIVCATDHERDLKPHIFFSLVV